MPRGRSNVIIFGLPDGVLKPHRKEEEPEWKAIPAAGVTPWDPAGRRASGKGVVEGDEMS